MMNVGIFTTHSIHQGNDYSSQKKKYNQGLINNISPRRTVYSVLIVDYTINYGENPIFGKAFHLMLSRWHLCLWWNVELQKTFQQAQTVNFMEMKSVKLNSILSHAERWVLSSNVIRYHALNSHLLSVTNKWTGTMLQCNFYPWKGQKIVRVSGYLSSAINIQ